MSSVMQTTIISASEPDTSVPETQEVSPDIDYSSLEFNRKNIELLNKNIRLVDSDPSTGLDLFCYIKCNDSDPEIFKQSRGVVFHGEDVVMRGFPYTIEYTEKDNEKEINDNVISIFDKCVFYDSYEGSLIRMFHYGGKWYLSTNRKLDAFRSKWASRESFGSFFQKALEYEVENNERLRDALNFDKETDNIIEKFQGILDTSKQYMFLLLNNAENRIVCDAPEHPTVFHVGTFINFELSMDEDVYIPHPRKHEFANIGELNSYVKEVDYKVLQGVIVFAPDNKQYKIFNDEYKELYAVRNNEPSIKFRYLQVRMNKKYNDALHFLYPNFAPAFEEYENTLHDIAKEIQNSYIARFIKKEYVSVDVNRYSIISAVHRWHQIDRGNNKISLDKVIEVMNEQTPTNLNRMIRNTMLEKQGITPPVRVPRNNRQENSKPKEHTPLLQRKTKPVVSDDAF